MFFSLLYQSHTLKTKLPPPICDLGSYATFLEFQTCCPQDFLDFMHVCKRSYRQEYYISRLCVIIAQHLEDWQDKPGEYEHLVEGAEMVDD